MNGFTRKDTSEDVALPADTDNLHEDLSGTAMVNLMQRQYHTTCTATGAMNGRPVFPWLACTTSGSGPATSSQSIRETVTV